MCMICAAIPATAAVGAKLNADQLHKPREERKPVSKITGIVIALLVASSVVLAVHFALSRFSASSFSRISSSPISDFQP